MPIRANVPLPGPFTYSVPMRLRKTRAPRRRTGGPVSGLARLMWFTMRAILLFGWWTVVACVHVGVVAVHLGRAAFTARKTRNTNTTDTD